MKQLPQVADAGDRVATMKQQRTELWIPCGLPCTTRLASCPQVTSVEVRFNDLSSWNGDDMLSFASDSKMAWSGPDKYPCLPTSKESLIGSVSNSLSSKIYFSG